MQAETIVEPVIGTPTNEARRLQSETECIPPPYEAVDPHFMVYALGNIKLSMKCTDAPLSRSKCCNARATLLNRKDIIIATEAVSPNARS